MTKRSILLHICCGPCAIYPLKRLRELGFSVTGYFYNHNIHPYKEYLRRLETVRQFAADEKLELIIGGDYQLEEFLQNVADKYSNRCVYCYESRIKKTAEHAKQHEFAAFTTTLLVSPYQKHDLLVQIAKDVSANIGIRFVEEDFRSGWSECVNQSRERAYYRQPYCGCIYSEKERYFPKNP